MTGPGSVRDRADPVSTQARRLAQAIGEAICQELTQHIGAQRVEQITASFHRVALPLLVQAVREATPVACQVCSRPMRHYKVKAADAPGTVAKYNHSVCTTCHAAGRTVAPQASGLSDEQIAAVRALVPADLHHYFGLTPPAPTPAPQVPAQVTGGSQWATLAEVALELGVTRQALGTVRVAYPHKVPVARIGKTVVVDRSWLHSQAAQEVARLAQEEQQRRRAQDRARRRAG